MRGSFDEQLDSLRGRLVTMAATATSAIEWASQSLLEADLLAAGRVLEVQAELAESRRSVEEQVSELLARQQPVAADLRLAIAAMRVAGDVERMGALAAHIVKIMVLRHPGHAVPPQLEFVIRSMAEVAARLAWKVTRVLEVRDLELSAEVANDDDEMDSLHRQLFEVVLGDWQHGVTSAIDAALLGRFYERYADHVVNTARHVDFLITGNFRSP